MNRATRAKCSSLIRLCSGLDFFPPAGEVRDLLVDTLRRVAMNDNHAERIISRWLEAERRAPAVTDLIRLAGEVPLSDQPAPRPVNPHCDACLGLGFYFVQRDGYEGAGRCPRGCGIPASFQANPDRSFLRRWRAEETARAELIRAAREQASGPAPQSITSAMVGRLQRAGGAA
jgi:hypothetical protein